MITAYTTNQIFLAAYNHVARNMATVGDYPDEKMGHDAASQMQGDAGEGIILSTTGEPLNVNEKKLIRKLDLHLIPIVMLTYLLSFLDR